MASITDSIQLNESGVYGDLILRPNPNDYVVLTVPPFEAMLPFFERRLGRSLSHEEIETERKKLPSLVVTQEDAEGIAQARGSRP